jgi:hypothetical protein
MPSVSKKQHNLMAAVAKNPAFAKKVGIKQSVGEDFLQADKGKTFKQGGYMKKMKMKEVMGPKTMSEDVEKGSNKLRRFGEAKVQKREATKGRNLGDSGPTVADMSGGMKKGGKVKKYAAGGSIEKTKAGKSTPSFKSMGSMAMKKGGEIESKSEAKKEEKMDLKQDKAMIKKAFKEHDAQEHKGGKGTKLVLKHGGKVKKMARGGGIESKGKTKGRFC